MQNITVEIPAATFAALGNSPDEFVSEMRIAAAVNWYELGKLSQGKAAEVAGLTRGGFIDALSRFKVSPMQYTAEELAQALAKQGDWERARGILFKAPDVEPEELDKL